MDLTVIPLAFLSLFLLYMLIYAVGTGQAPHGWHILASRREHAFSYWSAVISWTVVLGICLGVLVAKILPA